MSKLFSNYQESVSIPQLMKEAPMQNILIGGQIYSY